MNAHTVLLGFLLYIVTVNARHFGDRINSENDNNDHESGRRSREGLSRHKRRSWQMSYGYDYPEPQNYYQNRRDHDRHQQDLIPHILSLLDEISTYMKRPALAPVPPQPIYIPYPVPYPVAQYCNCPATAVGTPEVKPNISSRFPEMEDTNQNWGFVDESPPEENDESDGSRPISFQPIVPKRPLKRVQPEVEHGSNQAGMSTQAPNTERDAFAANMPGRCDVFALSCCSGTRDQQRICFNNVGCGHVYNGLSCSRGRLLSIIDAYSRAFAPVN